MRLLCRAAGNGDVGHLGLLGLQGLPRAMAQHTHVPCVPSSLALCAPNLSVLPVVGSS